MTRILVNLSALFVLLLCNASYGNRTGLLFNVTSSGDALQIRTAQSNHTYPQVGIKITTSGYSLKNAGTECTLNANGYCLFPANDQTPTAISVNGPSGKMGAVLCLNGLGPLSCQHFENLSMASAPQYIYIVNAYNNSIPVSVCALDPTGGLILPCQDAGGESVFNSVIPQGIVINNLGTIAYISNGNGDSNFPDVFQCSIDSSTHTFNTCSVITINSPSGYTPYEGLLAINSANTTLYLTDEVGRVLACPINAGVLSGDCADTEATPVSENVAGIVVNNAGTIGYIGNYNDPIGVTVCAVSDGVSIDDSVFNNCINKTGGSINNVPFSFTSVGGVVLNNTESLLYIADGGANKIYACHTTPSNSATFQSCFLAGTTPTQPWNIVLNTTNKVAYITDFGSTTYSCPILGDGTFSTCTPFIFPGDTTGIALLY